MIPRCYRFEKLFFPGRVLIIYGPRRVGKTTLLNEFLQQTNLKYKLVSGDNISVRDTLCSQDFETLKSFVEGYELLAIDEAQNIENLGMGLKILVDEVPHLKIIVTGSSSFELSNKIGEPLTGRKRYLVLFPIAQMELNNTMNKFEQNKQLNNYLIYGSYPEVLTTNSKSKKIIILDELVNSYMLKDILVLENIKASNKLLQILKLLAFQIGSEVSLNEISSKVGLDVKTVDKYLNLLEKCFVIFRISGFSRNLRNEITSKCKYYFFDNGIRNSIINNFNNFDSRNDIGMLFENFIILERQKFNHYTNKICGSYFWRTHTQQEIDLIEDMNGKLNAFEITWSQNKTKKIPSLWKEYYPDSNYCVINNNNYLTYCI